ncbi:MAG: type II toxin-antitoxin system RelE/ParE family toxin [Nitrospinae bacterium]|nr:type II toxin-antitoxin system RelE/ParE family toxin [Nitrospinota bacterium]
MAGKISWSFHAADDLLAISEFIGKDSEFYSAAFARDCMAASRSLEIFPERGRVVPELDNPRIRELFIKEYRLVYLIEGQSIVILGLIHGKRDLNTLWKKDKR